MNSRIRTPFYIFFLNPDYVAARSLHSLRSNKQTTINQKKHKENKQTSKQANDCL